MSVKVFSGRVLFDGRRENGPTSKSNGWHQHSTERAVPDVNINEWSLPAGAALPKAHCGLLMSPTY